MTKQLSDLRTQVRDRGEYHSTTFVTNAEINTMINASLAELYDKMLEGSADWHLKNTPQSVTVVAGTQSYALASDFYRVMGVDVLDYDGDWVNLRRFNWQERNAFQDTGTERRWSRYRVMGSYIYITPTPDWNGTVRIWYTPTPPQLTMDTDTIGDVNFPVGWEEYVILDCLIKLAAKEESDATLLVAQKQAFERRLEALTHDRDDAEPSTVRDVDGEQALDNWIASYYRP